MKLDYYRCTIGIISSAFSLYLKSFYLCVMAEDLAIITGNKAKQYQSLIPQIKGLLEGESDLVANMANVVAALKEQFGWFWIGFYVVKPSFVKTSAFVKNPADKSEGDNDELVLAPFQGPVACTRIKKGRGVCGSSWAQAKTLIVPDVEKFPGHIACSSLSKSEIVLPGFRNEEVTFVIDLDSEQLNDFNDTDKNYLQQVVAIIEKIF